MIALPADTWLDEAVLAAVWPDSADLDSDTIAVLGASADAQCKAYAPTLAADAPVPMNYKMAVAMQVRNLWNATEVSSDGNMGEGGFTYQPRPMDWFVTSLLRPKRAKPVVG